MYDNLNRSPETPREKWLRRIGVVLDIVRWTNRLYAIDEIVKKLVELIDL